MTELEKAKAWWNEDHGLYHLTAGEHELSSKANYSGRYIGTANGHDRIDLGILMCYQDWITNEAIREATTSAFKSGDMDEAIEQLKPPTCPITSRPCSTNCAWFMETRCAVVEFMSIMFEPGPEVVEEEEQEEITPSTTVSFGRA